MNYLIESLTASLLTKDAPIDLVRCLDCGTEFRANGLGLVLHREQCKKNPAASVT